MLSKETMAFKALTDLLKLKNSDSYSMSKDMGFSINKIVSGHLICNKEMLIKIDLAEVKKKLKMMESCSRTNERFVAHGKYILCLFFKDGTNMNLSLSYCGKYLGYPLPHDEHKYWYYLSTDQSFIGELILSSIKK